MMTTSKITNTHLQKTAFVYIRQSSMGQVRHHRESTERQYALQETARSMGWHPDRIKVLDADLGQSGTSTTDRTDFRTLVTDVCLGKAGAVLAMEASRLARSNADWHRLIEICGITGTLIIDEDGCYDPSDFNDGLLLGLKGTMAQAELHFIRSRLQGGKLNKAQKGELRFPLPVGYVCDEANRIVKDPDDQVRSAIELVFETFEKTGSAYAVVQRFAWEKLLFPKRSYGGAWAGKLQWGRLTDSRVLAILRNPSYAGVYAFGRYQTVKEILDNGEVRSKIRRMPRDQWLVEILDHHDGYTSFEQHLSNLDTLERNRTNPKEAVLSGPAREGLALLQGLLVCRCCGRRLTVRYRGNGGIYPNYECNWRKREGLSKKSCLHVQCGHLDRAIERRVLEAIDEEQLHLAMDAYDIVQQRQQQIDTQWKLRLERAEYEAQLAERRYEEVDPSNRLVASTLEQRWNDALIELEDVRNQIADLQQRNTLIQPEQREEVLKLAEDLPRLWHSEGVSSKDKKRILRLLIHFVTLGVDEEVRMGETVFNIGAPGGRGIVASHGIVSAVAFTGVNPLSIALQSSTAFDEMIQFDAASNPGNSGGPLINLLGQQIGMVVSGIHTEEGIHFAIPTKTIRHCIPQVLCSELQRRYRSGIAIDPQLATVKIAKVDSDSPAAKAGIQVGDQILSVDGRPLRDPIDWAFSQAEWKPEQTLLFEILRGQELVEAEIKLAERTRLKSVVSPDVQSGLACRYTSYDPRVPSPLDQVKRPEGKVIVMDTVEAHPETLELQDHYVRWVEGLLKIEESGRYRFGLSSDDGSKLYLHNQILIDNDGNHAEILRTAWADLEKGLHPIRVEFYEDEGNQSLKLMMAKDDEQLAAVEANVLFHVSEE